MNLLVIPHASLPKSQAQTVRSWKGRAGASHSGRDTVRRIRGFLSPKSPEGQLETNPRDSWEPSRGEEPCHGRLRGGGAGFGAGTGSGCTGVADDGTPALVIALICAAILASIVLSWAATCWEIPSSFLLSSSNLTPEVTLLPSTFVLSWSSGRLVG